MGFFGSSHPNDNLLFKFSNWLSELNLFITIHLVKNVKNCDFSESAKYLPAETFFFKKNAFIYLKGRESRRKEGGRKKRTG